MTPALELGAVVAVGRLATVHRGWLGGRAVAVKRANLVDGAAEALRREARILRAATHPALVPVLEVIDDPLAPALVLAWADGGSLGDLLADGPLPAVDLIHILRPVAEGLDALHRAGVAHLDVTVGNVLLAASGPVLIDPAPPGAGTPGYTDPVVAAGGPASGRSDVFGLAACAHVALTGRLPRPIGGVAVGIALSPAVVEVLVAGLDPDPRRRPATASSFIDSLAVALDVTAAVPGRPIPADAVIRSAPAGRHIARSAGPVVARARTWPFDHWQEAADGASVRAVARGSIIAAASPGRWPRRRVALALLVGLGFAVAATLGLLAADHRWPSASHQMAPKPRRLTALDVPLQPVHRPPQPLEANHDTTTTDHVLACCPWPRTRVGG